MFEGYTNQAKRAVFLACWEARSVGARATGPDHLLAGLVLENEPKSAMLLREASVRLEAVRSSFRTGPWWRRWTRRPLIRHDDELRRVFAAARREAAEQGRSEVEPAHLVAALLQVPGSGAQATLVEGGLTIDRVRAAIGTP